MRSDIDSQGWNRISKIEQCEDCGSDNLDKQKNSSTRKGDYAICEQCGWVYEALPTG